MMHNELINYNSVIDSVIDSAKIKTEDHNMLTGIIHDKLKLGQSDGSPCVPKRQNYIDAVQRRRQESMNELNTQKMSVMFSSGDFVHHFILYRMDDGRIADVYIKLTADKNVDVFEYSVVQT